MTKKEFTNIKINLETKAELDKLKKDKESYNCLLSRLVNENVKLNKILSNVENLQEHLQQRQVVE